MCPVSKPFVVYSLSLLMYLNCPNLHNIKEKICDTGKYKKYTNWAVQFHNVPQTTVICVDTVPNSTQSASPAADKVGPFGNLKESNGITCARAAVDEGTCAGVY